jgi:hypothetical protein
MEGLYGSGHRGRGPRDYTRSDARITEDLNERLTDDDDLDASNITVRVNDGVATLEGTVESRWLKHRAEDIADSCSGVKDVRNELRVSRGNDQDMGQSTTGTDASGSSRTRSGKTTGTSGGTPSGSPGGTTGSAAH